MGTPRGQGTPRGLLSDSGYHDYTEESPKGARRYHGVDVGAHRVVDEAGGVSPNFNLILNYEDGLGDETDYLIYEDEYTPLCCPCAGCRICRTCRTGKRCKRAVSTFCCLSICKPATRILLSICGIMLLTSVSLAMTFRIYYTQPEVDVEFSLGDQSIVGGPFWATFCREMHLDANHTFNAFHLKSYPGCLENTMTMNFLVAYHNRPLKGRDKLYAYYNFLAGSSISITIGIDQQAVEFYIIQGEDNYKIWEQHGTCSDCFLEYSTLTYAWGSWSWTYKMEINTTDSYYYVISNPLSDQPGNIILADIVIDMNRTVYSLKNSVVNDCDNVTSCVMKLKPFSHERVMVEYLHRDRHQRQTYVTVSCKPRLYIYGVIFIIIPCLLSLSVAGLIVACFKKKLSRNNQFKDGDVDSTPTSPSPGSEFSQASSPTMGFRHSPRSPRSPRSPSRSPRSPRVNNRFMQSMQGTLELKSCDLPHELINHI